MKKTNKKQNGGINNPNGLANFEEDFLLPPSTTNLDDVQDEENKFLFGGRFSKESRAERKAGRKARREDRKKTRSAVKAYKKAERNKRRDKVNDAGEDISMSRADKRENRKTVRATTRAFKKEERSERRESKRALLAKQKKARQDKKAKTLSDRNAKVKENVSKLNKVVGDDTSSKSTKKVDTTNKNTTKKDTVKKKSEGSFGDAFKNARKNGKKEFTWKGKKYHTRTKEEEAKKKKTTTKKNEGNTNTKKKNMGPHPKHDQDGNGVPDSIQKRKQKKSGDPIKKKKTGDGKVPWSIRRPVTGDFKDKNKNGTDDRQEAMTKKKKKRVGTFTPKY